MVETNNLKQKSLKGFQWAVIDNFANQGIVFLVGIVLANLLSPTEFGIIGLITVFVNLSTTIIDGGFVTALIRKTDADDNDYNTVLYSNLGISVVLMALLIASSSALANLFDQPQLSSLMPVMSIVLLINAFTLIPKTQFVKRIDFRHQALASVIASLSSGVVGIGLALAGYGVWSLAWQQIVRHGVLALGFWLLNDWRPSLCFSYKSFKDLFGFGSRLLAANLINALFKDAFVLVIGKMYSSRSLGFYNRAEQFNLIVSNNLSQVIQRVTMPALSLVQDDKERLQATFRKFLMYSAMLTFALAFGLAAIAKPLILTLINEQWLPCVRLLQIMSLYGALYPLQQLNLNILSVTKHSDYFLRLEVIKKILFIPVIVVGFFLDMEAMIWGAVIYYFIEFRLNSWYAHRLINYSTWQQIRDLAPIYIISISVSFIIWSITLIPISLWLILCLQLGCAPILYYAIYRIIRQPEFTEILQMAKTHLYHTNH